MAFYKVAINCQMQGQQIKSFLYYRTGVGVDVGGLTLGGASDLAEEVENEIVPKWRRCIHSSCTIDSVDVYPYNDTFQLMYTLPHTRPINLPGLAGGSALSPAAGVMIKFGFESAVVGQALIAPRKGYVIVGGGSEDFFDGGRLVGSVLDNTVINTVRGAFHDLAQALAGNLENLAPPVIWFPVRAKRALGGLFVGWSDINSANYDDRMLWRRSRQPES